MKLIEIVEKYASYEEFINAVEEQLKKLIKENPDFIYNRDFVIGPTCYYNRGPDHDKDSCSGCIFGQALQNLGWNNDNELNFIGSIKELFRTYISRSCDVPSYWANIQFKQDKGFPWKSLDFF